MCARTLRSFLFKWRPPCVDIRVALVVPEEEWCGVEWSGAVLSHIWVAQHVLYRKRDSSMATTTPCASRRRRCQLCSPPAPHSLRKDVARLFPDGDALVCSPHSSSGYLGQPHVVFFFFFTSAAPRDVVCGDLSGENVTFVVGPR